MNAFGLSPMLRLQLLSIGGTGVFNVGTAWILRDTVPPANGLIGFGAIALFLAVWAGSVAWIRLKRPPPEDTVDGWFANSVFCFWLGDIACSIALFAVCPWFPEPVVILVVMVTLFGGVIQTLATVRAPGYGPRGLAAELAPFVMAAFQIVYFLIYRETHPLWPFYIFFLVCFCAAMQLFRTMLQAALDRAHAAQLTAEAERDARTRFLASASHDLGQPLQSARLFFDQSARSPDARARATATAGARQALGAMDRLLRQLLDHLKLEAGSMQPQLVAVEANAVMAQIASQFQPLAGLAGGALKVTPSSLMLHADPDMLERALGNLVDNALRHADARRVLIGVRRRGDRARIWVVDDGRGVAAADLPGLFEDYVQGADRAGRERGGFGLGLASVRRFAALMGGSAGLDARWTKGSAFYLDVPVPVGRLTESRGGAQAQWQPA